MRQRMLDELDQQDYFTTVLFDGHNGAFDFTTVSADAFAPIELAADDAAYYTPDQERIIATERIIRHAIRDAKAAGDVIAAADWKSAMFDFDADPAGFCGVTL